MALTDAQKHLVFEVLDVPNAASVVIADGAYGLTASQTLGGIVAVRDEILSILAGLSDALETRLAALLVEWEGVASSGLRIEPNGSNDGVSLNFARDRSRIRSLVQKIVPVMVAGRDSNAGGAIPLG